MEKSKVYYTSMRTGFDNGLLDKLKRLIKKAGIENIDFDGKYTAIKMHFGEPGNLAFLRPNYAKVVADTVKELGGKPFLTDCNTLYVGGHKNALDHIESAYVNGFSPLSTGCHIIIGDGLKGTDEVYVPVEGGEYVKEAKIGRAIMDADVFISLAHFKGHEATGFGGTLKNIGMGCGSRAGKMEMHSAGKPHVEEELCIGCHRCIKACEHDAITVNEDGTLSLDRSKCDVCKTLDCAHACPAQGMIIYGENKTVDQILKEVEKDALFYARSGGGMTLSGGEPLMHADIALPLLREARHRRIKTAIETCGCIPWDTLKEAAPYLNYVLFDVKQMDSEKHREGAGVGNELILSNLKKLLTEFPNLHVQVRTPIIPGFNDNDEFAYALGEFLKGHENVGYEALPYHRLGTQKYDFLSREYAMGDVSLPDGVAQRIQRIVDETRGAVTEEKK